MFRDAANRTAIWFDANQSVPKEYKMQRGTFHAQLTSGLFYDAQVTHSRRAMWAGNKSSRKFFPFCFSPVAGSRGRKATLSSCIGNSSYSPPTMI